MLIECHEVYGGRGRETGEEGTEEGKEERTGSKEGGMKTCTISSLHQPPKSQESCSCVACCRV